MQTSRRGKMAFVTLDDGKDQAEIVVFNEVFDRTGTCCAKTSCSSPKSRSRSA